MQNIDEERTANSGDEISVYNIVVTDNGTHNDGIRDKSSSEQNGMNGIRYIWQRFQFDWHSRYSACAFLSLTFWFVTEESFSLVKEMCDNNVFMSG